MLRQGHRDTLPLVLQPRAQASFPPTAGRALTVVACTKHGARSRQKQTSVVVAVGGVRGREEEGGRRGRGGERRERRGMR